MSRRGGQVWVNIRTRAYGTGGRARHVKVGTHAAGKAENRPPRASAWGTEGHMEA